MTTPLPASEALKLRKETSLTAIIYAEVLRMIEAGELLPGGWVNEAELAARFGVSRGPVREACRGLEQQRLLRFVVNRGAFVREISVKEASEIYDMRAALFALAGRLLAPCIPNEAVVILEDLVRQMDKAVADRSLETYYPLNLEFHRTILQFSGNERLRVTYEGCVRELHLFRRQALIPQERMQQSNADHKQILNALRAHDAQKASLLMEAHVLKSKERMLQGTANADVAHRAAPRRPSRDRTFQN